MSQDGGGSVFVVGMHRSGTSALAGLLAKAGLYFGPEEQQLPTKEANPRGYWERWDVVYANDHLLQEHRLEWHRVSGYRPELFEQMPRETAKRELASIVGDYEQNGPWFVKDPRICLTLPCWLPLVENPVCIFMLRDPLQIASSLASRGDCSPHVGLALWELYTAAALWNTRGIPRHILHYDGLLADPCREMAAIHSFLAHHQVGRLRELVDADIASWLDQGLKREQVCAGDYPDYLNAGQQALFDSLTSGDAFDPGAPYRGVSSGGQAALKNHEILHLQMVNEIDALKRRVADCQLEVDVVRKYKADMARCNDDLEKCADVLEATAGWKLHQAAANVLAKIKGQPAPASPFDRIRDIIAAQKNLQGLGEPEA